MTLTATRPIKRDIKAERMAAAKAFRERMTEQGTLVVRLMSSPGAGKTTLLQMTAKRLAADHSVAVLVGDVETDRDALRLAPFAPTHQITTGGACHLELPLVESALPKLGVARPDFLFIEDIGNLICPASHELGEHLRVVLLSTTEGDDKPGKYPKAFRTSQVAVITKTDLLPHVPFSLEEAQQDIRQVRGDMKIFVACALQDEVGSWCDFLIEEQEKLRQPS